MVRPSKKVSAFAVAEAQKGKHKLDDDITIELAHKVKKLHKDDKFNKKAVQIATNYEKNRLGEEKKKKKRKERRKEMEKLSKAQDTVKPSADSEPVVKPLCWYNAPKSDKKESSSVDLPSFLEKRRNRRSPKSDKKVKGEESLSADFPSHSTKKRRDRRRKSQKIKLATTADQSAEESPVEPTEIVPALKPTQNGFSKSSGKRVSSGEKLNSKKVSVEEWTVPDLSGMEMEDFSKSDGSEGPADQSAQTRSDENHSEQSGSDDESASEFEHEDPEKVARELFAKLIYPHDPKTFFKNTWTKRPMLIKRKNPTYYEQDDWFSTQEMDRILTEERVRFGVNIDLTTYQNGKRETHNPAGRAYPSIVWDHYQQGCSVRLLNPQTYSDQTWYLLSTLQELFGCMVGANVYLTPPGTQGFAPHYDDIEGFVLQLEGKKHWKVYGPRTNADIWPLTSSPNLTEEELSKPLINCILEPGDLLYFPRGAIHQAMAQDDEHSLHITVSTHQKNSWSDLLNLMLPAALANATENDAEFRESLPNDYLNYTGIAFLDQEGAPRKAFLEKIQKLMDKLVNYAPVDGACDLMAKKFIHDSLPPFLDPAERVCSVAEQGEKWVKDDGVRDAIELQPDTRVRLIRKHSLRIVNEPEEETSQSRPSPDAEEEGAGDTPGDGVTDDNVIRVYYNTDNDRLYHGNDLQYLEVDGELAPAIEYLQLTYPEFCAIDSLPIEDITNKVDVAKQLYDHGLLLTEEILEPIDGVESDSECSGSDSTVSDCV